MAEKYLKQAHRQVAASGGHPVVWIFAEQGAADFARELFDANGLKQITVVEVSWTRSERQ
jgi:NADPH-dependent ferric siderophore reductase